MPVDAGQKLLDREWLCQVVVNAQLRGAVPIVPIGSRRHHDDGHLDALLAHPAEHLEAIHVRQSQIEH